MPAPNLTQLRLNDYQSDAGLARWIQALGIPDAPVRRAGVKTTLEFLARQMASLPVATAVSFMRAMDLSKPVKVAQIAKGETLVATRTFTESPYKLFFTRVGRSLQNSGINPANRHSVIYTAFLPFTALESFAAPAIDTWTPQSKGQKTTVAPQANTFGVMAAGGNTQLLIPNSASKVRVERVSTR